MATQSRVVVIGSINLDVVCEVAALPGPGETVLATGSRRNVGGKGSNQAVAAALAGADVAFVGRVGDDDVAGTLREGLVKRGVDVAGLRTVPGATSGSAYILVGEDNIITVDSGANFRWESGLDEDVAALRDAGVVVAQLEVPVEVVTRAAAETTGRFVLNAAPSPSSPLPDALLRSADPLVVNEHELADITGTRPSGPDDAESAARALHDAGTPSVVVTLGGDGALWVDAGGSGRAPAPTTEVVDTTGAGDAFVGNLAAALAAGAALGPAVERAVLAASLSVRSPGTHDSYPDAAAVDAASAAR